MIELMTNLPPGVLGFTAHGQITAADYENVLVPDIEAAFALSRKLRMIFHTADDFVGFDAGAMWDDAKLGFRHITSWDRVALVTDVGWMRTVSKMFGFAMPCTFQLFGSSVLDDARQWIGMP